MYIFKNVLCNDKPVAWRKKNKKKKTFRKKNEIGLVTTWVCDWARAVAFGGYAYTSTIGRCDVNF